MSNQYISDITPAGDYESITVSTSVVGPAADKLLINQTGGFHKRAVKALITVEGAATLRLRYDGTDPTSSEGHEFGNDDSIIIQGEGNLGHLKFIRAGGSDMTVKITYFYNL